VSWRKSTSSDSHHCSAELTDVEIENAKQFRAVTSALFSEVKQALEAEIAGAAPRGASNVDLWAVSSGGNGHDGNGRKPSSRQDAPTTTPPADRNRGHSQVTDAKITNRQAKFALGLARKSGLSNQVELGRFIHEKLGTEAGLYDLTRKQGSTLIDILNSNNGNGGNGR